MSHKSNLFLSGVLMQPAAIRDYWPASRFLARARVEANPDDLNPDFADAFNPADGRVIVWGIVVEAVDPIEGPSIEAITDAGESVKVILAELPLLAGDPEAVLAAALYWELPPAFTTQLRAAAGVEAPEAEGGWESPLLEAEPPSTGS